jgi:hypothetical protein
VQTERQEGRYGDFDKSTVEACVWVNFDAIYYLVAIL